jgi:hypothetical protein
MYMELKLNIISYCGLLWSLFGDHCDYYKELLKLYCIWIGKSASPSGRHTQKKCALE